MRFLVSGLLLAMGFAATASAQTVNGTYAVAGTNADGTAYKGTAEITWNGTACAISWQTGSSSAGTCLLTGKAFGASYQLGDATGIAVYEVQPDGTLKGQWTTVGTSGVGTETLTPNK